MEFISLELELSVERLKRYLQHHPERATELTVSYFEERPRVLKDTAPHIAVRRKRQFLQRREPPQWTGLGMRDKDFSVLAIEHKRLEADFKQLQSDSIKRDSASLPSFLNSNRGMS